jgi:hypothetical protein
MVGWPVENLRGGGVGTIVEVAHCHDRRSVVRVEVVVEPDSYREAANSAGCEEELDDLDRG